MSWRKFLLIPRLVWLGMRAPRKQREAWNRYWGGIERTGPGGQVLWDADDAAELETVLARVLERMDRALPVVDVGCGNGRFSRLLAAHFPRVHGVDLAENAIGRARAESAGIANVDFRVLDASASGATDDLTRELGTANVFVRGVFHVLDDPGRRALAANIRALLGDRGVLYVGETNIAGDPLGHLEYQGATPTYMPEALERCVAAGIRPPSEFGDRQVRACFPAPAWDIVESGPITMYGVPLTTKDKLEKIPGWFAVVRPASTGERADR